jgi:hypothetical protein
MPKKLKNIQINNKSAHPTEINRCRFNPFSPQIIASLGSAGPVYISDLVNKKIEFQLEGHSGDGFGLAWNKEIEGVLASGA